ncbi:hypothetical protein BZA70DRAFT_264984 [Myxozyma melibiosi]|uniref:Uncharacterized protein n=1 Tax=Myxozyma melibiosi TaxID=54550 RepID=A0ABR1FEM8_9ASCO
MSATFPTLQADIFANSQRTSRRNSTSSDRALLTAPPPAYIPRPPAYTTKSDEPTTIHERQLRMEQFDVEQLSTAHSISEQDERKILGIRRQVFLWYLAMTCFMVMIAAIVAGTTLGLRRKPDSSGSPRG